MARRLGGTTCLTPVASYGLACSLRRYIYIEREGYIYIYIYIYTCPMRLSEFAARFAAFEESVCDRQAALDKWFPLNKDLKMEHPRQNDIPSQMASRPVFKSSIWENEPRPWEISAFKGYFGVKLSNGSGIQDTRFEMLRIEIMRTGHTDSTLVSQAPPVYLLIVYCVLCVIIVYLLFCV